jgi:hypothetical protein
MTRSVLRAAQLEAIGADPVVADVFDAEEVRAAMADAAPDAVIHQLTSLPPRINWGPQRVRRAQPPADRGDPDPRQGGACQRREPLRGAEHRVRLRAGRRLRQGRGRGAVHRRATATRRRGGGGRRTRATGHGYGGDRWPGAALRHALRPRHLVRPARLHVGRHRRGPLVQRAPGAPGIYHVIDDEPALQSERLPVLAQALRADPPAVAEVPPPPAALEMWLRGASNAKARRELGWRPRYASWREGFGASLA